MERKSHHKVGHYVSAQDWFARPQIDAQSPIDQSANHNDLTRQKYFHALVYPEWAQARSTFSQRLMTIENKSVDQYRLHSARPSSMIHHAIRLEHLELAYDQPVLRHRRLWVWTM